MKKCLSYYTTPIEIFNNFRRKKIKFLRYVWISIFFLCFYRTYSHISIMLFFTNMYHRVIHLTIRWIDFFFSTWLMCISVVEYIKNLDTHDIFWDIQMEQQSTYTYCILDLVHIFAADKGISLWRAKSSCFSYFVCVHLRLGEMWKCNQSCRTIVIWRLWQIYSIVFIVIETALISFNNSWRSFSEINSILCMKIQKAFSRWQNDFLIRLTLITGFKRYSDFIVCVSWHLQ